MAFRSGFGRNVRTASLAVLIGSGFFAAFEPYAEAVLPTRTSTPADEQDAERLFQQGKAAAKSGDWSRAYDLFADAFRHHSRYDIAGNLGHAALELHKSVEAADYLAYCIRMTPASADSAKRAATEKLLEKAKTEVVTIRLVVRQPAARLLLDGKDVGTVENVGSELFVAPGEHALAARLDGFREARAFISEAAGATRAIELKLEAEPTGTTGSSPSHELSSATDHPSGRPLAPASEEGSSGMPPRTLVLLLGGGLTLISAGVGIGFAIDASSSRDRENDLHADAIRTFGTNGCNAAPSDPICTELDAAVDRTERSRTWSIVGFVGAGVLGAATAATFLLWPRQVGRRTVGSAHLLLGPATAALEGHF